MEAETGTRAATGDWAALPPRARPSGEPLGGAHPQDAQKEAELALQRSDARWRALLSSMLDPMVAIDVTGTIQAASDSMLRVFGWRPDELVGRNVNVLMPEPHRSAHDGYLAHYRETGHTAIIGVTREFEVQRKDGSRRIAELSVGRADDPSGEGELFIGTFRDVTERKRAEEALRESERRFHAIFDGAYQYLGLLAPDGTVLEANQTALSATGTARESVVGRPFWDTPWWSFSAAARGKIQAAVKAAASGEFVRFEIEVRGKDDALFDLDFSLKPVFDEQGQVELLIPEGRDISEIKRAQRAEMAMLRALATIGESAALLAHEIKNPITAVNLALRAVADRLGEDHKAVLEDLVGRMKRLEELMRRTLSFARPLDLRRAAIDARELLAGTVAHLRGELVHTGSDAIVLVPEQSVQFAGDGGLLEEVLANLVRNAIEAQGRNAHVRLSAARTGSEVRIAVEDDGPGIPESVRATLFKPFTTTKQKGNGLGLAICKKIVEEHGGTIEIDARRTVGARFEIRLPTGL